MGENDHNPERRRYASDGGAQPYNPWVTPSKIPSLPSEVLRIPEKIRERCLLPSEQILFVSCDVLLWTRLSIRKWTYERVKWLVLTDKRLLFIDHDSLSAQYQLDPEFVRHRLSEWSEFQEIVQSQQRDPRSLGWRQRFRVALAIRKEESNIAKSEKIMTITKIEKKRRVFIRRYGIVRWLILIGLYAATIRTTWLYLIVHYSNFKIFNSKFVLAALCLLLILAIGIRIRPWNEILLTMCILIYNRRGKMGRVRISGRLGMQFNSTNETERFINMIEHKVATLASAVSSS